MVRSEREVEGGKASRVGMNRGVVTEVGMKWTGPVEEGVGEMRERVKKVERPVGSLGLVKSETIWSPKPGEGERSWLDWPAGRGSIREAQTRTTVAKVYLRACELG